MNAVSLGGSPCIAGTQIHHISDPKPIKAGKSIVKLNGKLKTKKAKRGGKERDLKRLRTKTAFSINDVQKQN
ncbi:hypothetical protein DM860_008982 [Cuscuta australis]|uniref:Uncharacterized protein n=1 Tax=Cuscuta australis TaxID=267555 RepID=A0A328D9G0_9ASTE|nr:hypothetical protein DM860_008982 [Cuscuta australis]